MHGIRPEEGSIESQQLDKLFFKDIEGIRSIVRGVVATIRKYQKPFRQG